MKLRDYQEAAVRSVLERFASGDRVLLISPTGAGKTRMAAAVAGRFGSTLWVVDRLALIDQTLAALGVSAGAIHPMYRPRPGAPVQVVTRQTLMSRGSVVACDLLVYDESHHACAPGTFDYLLGKVRFRKALGLTATPSRSDRIPLGRFFESHVLASSYPELIDSGSLVRAMVLAPERYVGPHLSQPMLDTWIAHGEGRQTLAFCARQDICLEQSAIFRGQGIRSEVVLDDTAGYLRDRRMSQFSLGRLDVLFSVSTLTEGVDFPAASCAILGRSFATVTPYMQACGRVLRPHETKSDALIIDLVGASVLHGPPDVARVWDLYQERESLCETSGSESEHGEFSQRVIDVPLIKSWLPESERRQWVAAERIDIPPVPIRTAHVSVCDCGAKLRRSNSVGKCSSCLLASMRASNEA